MIHIGLFEGIGGFSLAASWMGWQTYLTCEINPFAQRVLKYYWPDAYHHGDIKTLTYETVNAELTKRYGEGWRKQPIILTGGFPCQPFSVAGKRKGKDDDRHLWPEMLRVIREVQPTWVIGENVPGLVNWSEGVVFEEVQSDLEAEGYEVQSFILPAAGIGAPHRRDRVWIVAYSYGIGHRGGNKQSQPDKQKEREVYKNQQQHRDGIWGQAEGCSAVATNPSNTRLQRGEKLGSIASEWPESDKQPTGCICPDWQNFPTQSPICSGDDGISNQLDGITFSKWRKESIKAYGNAIVPHLAYAIFKAIDRSEINFNK